MLHEKRVYRKEHRYILGSPSVVVSLTSSKEIKEGIQTPQSQFGSKVMGFTNMNDMMKDINKMIAGGANQSLTSIRMDIPEYKKMNLAVGDKVFLEITKADSSGV